MTPSDDQREADRKVIMPAHVEKYSMFERIYAPCDCGGWDEKYEGRSPLRDQPTGITLQGRHHHMWGCTKRAAALSTRPALPAGDEDEDLEVLVEGSWFKRDELPTILGNYMRDNLDLGRELKNAALTSRPSSPQATDEEPWCCERCGSERWVGHAYGPQHEGFKRNAQCVPCGHVQDLPTSEIEPQATDPRVTGARETLIEALVVTTRAAQVADERGKLIAKAKDWLQAENWESDYEQDGGNAPGTELIEKMLAALESDGQEGQ